jgi:hypothetical protein
MIVVSLATQHSKDEDIEATNFKAVGDAMHADDPEYFPGYFGIFGAKTAFKKLVWAGCTIGLVFHVVMAPAFNIKPLGVFYVWLCVILSILFMLLFLVLGAKDLKEMVADMKAAIARKSAAEK